MGLYPSSPGRRMAWDIDGSVAMWATYMPTAGGLPTPTAYAELNDADKRLINNESMDGKLGAGAGTRGLHFVVIFPELREIDGSYWNQSGSHSSSDWIYRSGDTTNGRDGTWAALGSQTRDSTTTDLEAYRKSVESQALNTQRAVMLQGGNETATTVPHLRRLHLYGEISLGHTPDRLLFIDEDTGLEFDTTLDFEERPRGSALEWQWRLKNNSTAAGNNLTINGIQFTAESEFLESAAWYTFSIGGDAYVATKQITSLAAEAESALITGRQIILVDEVMGVHAARIVATVTSLS